VEELLSTVSPARNRDVQCRQARACGLPPVGPTIDSGMYHVASASLERQGADDILPLCWGSSGYDAEALEAECCCTPSQCRGGASAAESSPSS
jgi:hypothetical protein